MSVPVARASSIRTFLTVSLFPNQGRAVWFKPVISVFFRSGRCPFPETLSVLLFPFSENATAFTHSVGKGEKLLPGVWIPEPNGAIGTATDKTSCEAGAIG